MLQSSFQSDILRRPGEGTRTGVLSVCLGALGRPCWLSLRSDCGLVAPCPQASHPAGPDPRRSGFPSCVTRFFGSWRHAAAVFVLLFVKILLDIHHPQPFWGVGLQYILDKQINWKQRWDGSAASLACQSRRPHSHPNQHTEAELKLIRDMRRQNPTLGMVELWHRLRQRGYTPCPESLFRVMRKMRLFPAEKWSASSRTTALSLPTVFPATNVTCRRCLRRRPPSWEIGIN